MRKSPNHLRVTPQLLDYIFIPNSVVKIATKIQPSKRGEFEISSVNQYYLDNKDLKIEILGRGFTWLDTGTHDSLLEASNFIKTVEKHSGYKVACLEEIAFKMKFIDLKKLKELTKPFGDSSYGKYLKSLVMKINKTFIEDLLIIEPQLFKDDRGFFYESYNKNNLDKLLICFCSRQ